VTNLASQYLSYVGPRNKWGEAFGLETLSGNPTLGASQTLITVPEPSTWAMVSLGFAGLGYAAFHRREKRAAVPA